MTKLLFKFILFLGVIIVIPGCEEIIPKPPTPINTPGVNFEIAFNSVSEDAASAVQISLLFGKTTSEAGTFDIEISSTEATYNTDYTTSPVGSGGSFTIDVASGSTGSSFSLTPVDNALSDGNKIIDFTITNATGGVSLGTNLTYELTIIDDEQNDPVTGDYADCLNILSDSTLDVVTWNIEQFSSSNTNTALLAEMIEVMDADIIGVQEISSYSDFSSMVNGIDGWNFQYVNQGDGLSLGYLYKTSEITLNGSLTTIYDNETSAFPRAPVVGDFTHIPSGTQVTIMNLHLKCCDDGEARRLAAAELLKGYIDTNLATENVLVIGDYNDDIQESPATNVFQGFIDDATNYRFVDMIIAQGSSSNWSYPGWPSHLDHILMTNELFDEWQSTSTLKLDVCKTSYEYDISDHRPVLARFKVN
ncbi:MAG: endonuclease/exonuclease/phosphatase family protein [Bacteroidota bacterium]